MLTGHCVNKNHIAAALGGFVIAANDHSGFHRRAVKEIRSQPKYTIHQVGVHQFLAHVRFFFAKQDSVREENGTASRFIVHAFQDVLKERIVRTSLRRRAEEVTPPYVTCPCFAAPLFDGIRRVRQHHVKGGEAVFVGEGGTFECIPAGDRVERVVIVI